jgi:ribosomal protein S18 acetylase RimI-like enzyme
MAAAAKGRATKSAKATKAAKPPKPLDPTAFKRDGAGTYRSGDGRFSIEQSSGRWLVVDAEQQDDLGLPLVRGPFDTLVAARSAAVAARDRPAPESDLGSRPARPRRAATAASTPKPRHAAAAAASNARPKPPPLEIRRYAAGDEPAMRRLWAAVGFKSSGDDDESLDRLAERNPGLVLVATEGDRIVATALGAWDGRRGWIYHLATDADHRRAGLGRRLVHEVERKLRALGCPRVNVIVRDDNPGGTAFWEALGYVARPSRQFGRDL